jgi:glycosyltransferase involved in cell wall biosynthesis
LVSRLPDISPTFRLGSIAAKNYLPSVCLLAESFRLHHPDVSITVLVIDADKSDSFGGLPFEVVLPDELPLSADQFGQMATYYDVTELSTALKPPFLQLLLDRGADAVMYLDPDIEVFDPLYDLFELATQHEIVLTPHVTRPVPRDGLATGEEAFLISGQFNLGFVCVSPAAGPFLDYWWERTRLFAIRDPAAGYFTDQRWVDAVPSLFEHVVVRDTACNVAYWNLHERELDVDERDRWTIDGEPLKFFHYSGHDSGSPYRLSKHINGNGRVRVDQHPPLRRLLLERSERINERSADAVATKYGLSRSARGVRLDPSIRRYYWNAARAAEHEGVNPPPHAFGDDGGAGFRDWCCAPVAPGSRVPNWLYSTWQARLDLREAFPDALGEDSERLLGWALESDLETSAAAGVLDTLMDLRLAAPLPGVNLIGYLDGEFGVGAAGRLVARMIRAAGVPLASTVVSPEHHSNRDTYPAALTGAPFEMSVMAMNADMLLTFAKSPGWISHRDKKRVGVWYWEVPMFPEHLRPAFDLVDEVWCASDYVRATLAEWSDRPVAKHPLVIDVPGRTALTREDLGLPEDRFLFGFVFDYMSVMKRKNPVGLIEAYRNAFGPDDGATLVLKSINAAYAPESAAAVREAAGDRADILFLDGHLQPLEMRALFELLDCYVSLHRSEGLGLTIASAMAAGTPAIATGWSGNLEFMTPENSVLAPYDLIEVGPGVDPYPAAALWADPRRDDASAAMRRLFDHPDIAAQLGRTARADLRKRHDAGTAASWFEARFNSLTGSKVLV